jgi:hypothetical protein
MELIQDHVQSQALVLAVVNHWVLEDTCLYEGHVFNNFQEMLKGFVDTTVVPSLRQVGSSGFRVVKLKDCGLHSYDNMHKLITFYATDVFLKTSHNSRQVLKDIHNFC